MQNYEITQSVSQRSFTATKWYGYIHYLAFSSGPGNAYNRSQNIWD